MTREEAMEILKDLWRTKYSTYLEADIRKALEMAMQALEQITKIADIVDGTIDHFEYDDAMDTLYEIKGVIK